MNWRMEEDPKNIQAFKVSLNNDDSRYSSSSLSNGPHPPDSLSLSLGTKYEKSQRTTEPYSKGTFSCDFCTRPFSTKQGLQRHYVNSHDKTTMPWPCGECEMKFTLKSELTEHLKTVTHPKDFKNRDFACGFCRKKFFTEEQREDHWQSHYENPKPHSYAWKYSVYSCNECGKKFPSKEYCMDHLRKYETMTLLSCKRLGCSFCGKRFCAQQNLDWHEEFHKEEKTKPFDCKVCEIRFDSKKLLQRHFDSEFHGRNVKSNAKGNGEKEAEMTSEIKRESSDGDGVVKTEVSEMEQTVEIKIEREIHEDSILGLPYELQ